MSYNESDRIFWLGIGYRQGIPKETIAIEIDWLLAKYRLTKQEIVGIATIDLKAKDITLRQYCRENNFYLQTFDRSQLTAVEVPHPTAIVKEKVGIASVAEAAAILAASSRDNRAILVVPKQKLPETREKAIITVAIARYAIDRANLAITQ